METRLAEYLTGIARLAEEMAKRDAEQARRKVRLVTTMLAAICAGAAGAPFPWAGRLQDRAARIVEERHEGVRAAVCGRVDGPDCSSCGVASW